MSENQFARVDLAAPVHDPDAFEASVGDDVLARLCAQKKPNAHQPTPGVYTEAQTTGQPKAEANPIAALDSWRAQAAGCLVTRFIEYSLIDARASNGSNQHMIALWRMGQGEGITAGLPGEVRDYAQRAAANCAAQLAEILAERQAAATAALEGVATPVDLWGVPGGTPLFPKAGSWEIGPGSGGKNDDTVVISTNTEETDILPTCSPGPVNLPYATPTGNDSEVTQPLGYGTNRDGQPYR